MKKLSFTCVLTVIFLTLSVHSFASKPIPNYPHVQSGLDGFYYVKSIPNGDKGHEGITKVFKVGKTEDELVDSYSWYSTGQLFLGWNPISGKVALIKLENEGTEGYLKNKNLRLVFYIGGKELKSYSKDKLDNMGLEQPVSLSYGTKGDFKILGVQQIPATNEYVFSLEKNNGEVVSFDITTGEKR